MWPPMILTAPYRCSLIASCNLKKSPLQDNSIRNSKNTTRDLKTRVSCCSILSRTVSKIEPFIRKLSKVSKTKIEFLSKYLKIISNMKRVNSTGIISWTSTKIQSSWSITRSMAKILLLFRNNEKMYELIKNKIKKFNKSR